MNRRILLYSFWFGALLWICYHPVLDNVTQQWQSDEDMSHGIFVPFLSGFMLWERREQLTGIPVEPSRLGWAILALGALLALTGTLGAEIFLQRVAMVVSLIGVIVAFCGVRLSRAMAFPLFLLFFMLPLPGVLYKQITFPLQLLASRLAEVMLDISGYLVLRQGNVLDLAGQQISVVEACSGVRALFSLSFFSLAYGYLFCTATWQRWLLFASTIPVAIFVNAFRVYLTGVLGEIRIEYAQGFYHSLSGLFVLALALLMLIGVHLILTRISAHAAAR